MSAKNAYRLEFPISSDEDWEECSAKGFLSGVVIAFDGYPRTLTFYGREAFLQMCDATLGHSPAVGLSDVIIVSDLNRASIERAVEHMAEHGFRGFGPTPGAATRATLEGA